MIYLLLSLIIGVSSAIIVWVIFMVEKNLSPSTLRRLQNVKTRTYLPQEDKKTIDISLPDFEYKSKALGQILKKIKIMDVVKNLINLADIKLHLDTFVFLSLCCAFPFLMFILTPFKLMALFGLGAFFIPTMYVKYLINKRYLDFSKQFPDTLNLMASSLRAGHPLFAAINMVVEEMPKPISRVFETAKNDISLGIDTKEAFYSMKKNMPQSIDLSFFITAVLIQKEVGGNLAELLDSLSETIRERFKLMGQLRVQTAQTRLSGMVIGFVPVLVLVVIFFMNPDYVKPLFNTWDGQVAIAVAVVLSVVGFILIKKISDIEF